MRATALPTFITSKTPREARAHISDSADFWVRLKATLLLRIPRSKMLLRAITDFPSTVGEQAEAGILTATVSTIWAVL